MQKFLLITLVLFWVFLSACATNQILPEKIDVRVSRDEPAKDCKPLGLVQGRSTKVNATSEDALTDLKKDAALKGANYVVYETMGAFGGYMRGQGYYCP